MPILKKEFRDKYRPPQITFCPCCRGFNLHRQRFDKESGWTYFACDICEFFVGEEVTCREGLKDG